MISRLIVTGTNTTRICRSHNKKALMTMENSPSVSHRNGVATIIKIGLMMELMNPSSIASAR